MKTLNLVLLLALAQLTTLRAEDARFFRVVGPVATTITALRGDGYLTWTNKLTNATFVVQTANSLSGESNWVDYIRVPVINAITTHRIYDLNPPANMALIPAGEFTMGDTLDGSSSALPVHTNNISAFYMDTNLVTLAQWDGVYQWAITNGYSFDYAGSGKAANHPVRSINWYDMVKWSNARSEQAGLVPAYYTDGGQGTIYKTGQLALTNGCVKWGSGFRLPTEAEWEKAARGGLSGKRFPWGDTITHSQANYYSISSYSYDLSPTRGYHPTFSDGNAPYTSPAGYFGANGYGLYDMAGNVWQWCWDWYGSYTSAPQTDPRGPSGIVSFRVLHGGYYGNYAELARCANRSFNNPVSGSVAVGFRCARGF